MSVTPNSRLSFELSNTKLPYNLRSKLRIKGILKKNYHILDLLYHLYPTPAVSGTPQNQALDIITKNEPFYENRTCVSDENERVRRNWIYNCSNQACLKTYGNKDCE